MGEHEGTPIQHWLVALGAKVAYRAKAFIAGIGALLVGELVVLLSDPEVAAQLREAVPPALVPFLPVLTAVVIGLITHAVPNAQKPSVSSDDGVDSQET